MKNVYPLLIMVICLIGATTSRSQMRQLSLAVIDDMNEVQEFSFYSPSEGYVAFTKYIGFTTDSGRTIIQKFITLSNVNFNNYPVNLTFGFGIKGVKAFSRDTIIVYGDYGLVPSILYSINGGASFTLVYHDRYDPLSLKTGITSMVFPQDHTTGYAVEADRILKTTNKGLNWFVVKLDVDRYYDQVAAIDNNNIFAFSTRYESYKLVKTNNGGGTWTDVTLPGRRKEDITEKIVINDKDDWEKVIVLEDVSATVGLKRQGEIRGKTSGMLTYRTAGNADKKSMERLKKEAAELGAPFLLLTSEKDSRWTTQSIKKGFAYSYK